MTVKLSPVFQDAQFDNSGNLLEGGLLYTYLAGTTTPTATYTTETGDVEQANPIELNARGEPDNPIWLTTGISYKFVLRTAAGVLIRTVDNVRGVNDNTLALAEWVAGPTPTYVSATQFTLVGDQTSDFQVGRRVRATLSGGSLYGRISVSAFTTLTTVTVVWDSGSLDATLSAVSYGLISATNPSIDVTAVKRAASLTGTETLENKTLTSPVINSPTGDVVTLTGTQTLTNKTLTSATISVASGVAFPSTQSASADPNTLDDYEEGTWTPSVGGSATYNSQVGVYTKIGRVVYIQLAMQINVLGTGNTNLITGLPFGNSASYNAALAVGDWSGAAGSFVSVTARISPGQSSISVKTLGAAGTGMNTVAFFGDGAFIVIGGHYITD